MAINDQPPSVVNAVVNSAYAHDFVDDGQIIIMACFLFFISWIQKSQYLDILVQIFARFSRQNNTMTQIDFCFIHYCMNFPLWNI